MQKYRSGIMLIAFLVLLGVAFILRNPGVLPWKNSVEKVFPGFKEGKIDRVKIMEDVLVREGEEWKVESADNFPADKSKVELVLETTAELEKKEPVSKNKENHAKFGVDRGDQDNRGNQGRIRVKLSGEGKDFELIIGKSGPVFGSTYFRKGKEDKVYLADKSLGVIYNPGEWRDLNIGFRIQDSGFKNIIVENASGIYELEKKGEEWKLAQPKVEDKIVQSRVEDLVSRLTNLEAADATTSANLAETGLDKPVVKVKVEDGKGKKTLTIGSKNEREQRFVQVSGNPYIYLLTPSDYGVFEEINKEYFTSSP